MKLLNFYLNLKILEMIEKTYLALDLTVFVLQTLGVNMKYSVSIFHSQAHCLAWVLKYGNQSSVNVARHFTG